jgi:hypothetical protein
MGFPDPAVSTGFVHQLLSALPNIVDAAFGCALLPTGASPSVRGAHHHFFGRIDPVHLKHRLRDIRPDRGNGLPILALLPAQPTMITAGRQSRSRHTQAEAAFAALARFHLGLRQ